MPTSRPRHSRAVLRRKTFRRRKVARARFAPLAHPMSIVPRVIGDLGVVLARSPGVGGQELKNERKRKKKSSARYRNDFLVVLGGARGGGGGRRACEE